MPNLPEVDNLVKWLQEQDAATQEAARRASNPGGLGRPPIPVTVGAPQIPANLPPMGGGTTIPSPATTSPMSVGNLARAGGGGSKILGALRGVGKASGVLGTGLALEPLASGIGNMIGDAYRDTSISPNDYKSPARQAADKGKQSFYDSADMVAAFRPSARARISESAQPLDLNYPDDRESYAADAEQVPPEMLVPASDDEQAAPEQEADDFMKQVLATIEPRGAVQEQPDPESTQDLKELTKERQGVRQAEPTSLIGKVGRGISKFMAAGAGPYDPTRYDRQQLELEKAKQQFTPQEALRGQLAVAEREGRQKFNREAQLENMKTGGLDDVTKLKAGLGTTIYEKQQSRAAKKEELGIEHKNKMEEIGASGASQRESPEAQEARMQREIAVKYLYAFTPKEAKRLTGLDISQQGLDAIRVAAQKDNPMAIAVAQLLQTRIQNMNPQGGKAAPNLTTKALSQGQPEKKK